MDETAAESAQATRANRALWAAAIIFIVIALGGPVLLVLSIEFPWAGPVKALLWVALIGALIVFARARRRKWAAIRARISQEEGGA